MQAPNCLARVRRIAACLLLAVCLAAQEFRGTISGLVTDPQGAVIPGAKVIATRTETGAVTQTVSSGDGRYNLPFLSPGLYRIEAETAGFKRYVREGIRVSTNERLGLDLQMEVGQTTESVTINAAADLLVTTTASVGQVINSRQIENTPMQGRTPLILAQLAFGVIPNADPKFFRPFDDSGPASFGMGGAPNRSNELLLDGTPDTSVGGGMGYSPPVDAVEEVKVESFQADAAYGHTGGGTVNMLTKAGTNQFHGTAFNFNQSSALGATLFFTNRAGQRKNVSNYNQWGFTAGGPIVIPKIVDGRNRLFLFFAYEGINQKLPRATSTTVPTADQRGGNFSSLLALGANYQIFDPAGAAREGSRVRRQPFAGNIVPASRISPVAKNILNFYELPNQAGVADGRNNFFVGAVGEFNTFDGELARFDYNVSTSHKLFVSFRRNDRLLNNGTTFANPATGSYLGQFNWGTTVDDVYTFTPTLVLNTRLNWLRNGERRGGFYDGFDLTTLGFPASLRSSAARLNFPQINVGAYQGLGSDRGGGINLPYDNFQLFTSISKTTGRHTVKTGADIRLVRRSRVDYGQSSGTFTFGTDWTRGPLDNSPGSPIGQDLAALLLGMPTAGRWDLNAAESSQNLYAAFFVQDDVRVRPTLTFNLGLRYERELPTTERFNRSTNGYDFISASPIAAQAIAAYGRNPIPEIPASQFRANGGITFASASSRRLFQPPAGAWSPRFGVAWTPAALGSKTVLRVGMGIFYFPINRAGTGIDQTGFSQQTPIVPTLDGFLTPNATVGNPFPDGIIRPVGSSLGLMTNVGQGVGYYSYDVKNGYSLRWNFSVQHQISKDTVVEAGYVYNHGVKLELNRPFGFVPREQFSTSPLRDQAAIDRLTANVANPFAGLAPGTGLNGSTIQRQQLLRTVPQFTGVTERALPEGGSYFHMFQARVEKRFSHGIQFLANYLYSKLIEQRSRLNDSDPFPEKRISTDDRPMRFVMSLNWELPFGKGRSMASNLHPVLSHAVSGWTMNSVYTAQPGGPLGWGNIIFFGGDMAVDNRNIDQTFDVTRFNRNAAQQLASNIRTFPSQISRLRGHGVNNLDFSIIKNNWIKEKLNVQFRCEFFNSLNRPSFNAPNTTPTSAAFGTITSQANLARSTQLALRLIW